MAEHRPEEKCNTSVFRAGVEWAYFEEIEGEFGFFGGGFLRGSLVLI